MIFFSQPILVAPNKDFNFIKSRIENSSFCKGKAAATDFITTLTELKLLFIW